MAARRSFLLLIASVAGTALAAISTYVVAHTMGAEALGTVGYVMGLTGIAGLVGDLGFARAHLRFTSGKCEIEDSVSTYAVIVALLVGAQVVLLAIIPLAARVIGVRALATREEWILYVAFAAGLLVTSLTRLFSTTYYAQENVAKVGAALIAASLALALAKVSVAAAGLGIVALGIAYQADPIAKLVTLWILWRGYALGTPRRGIARRYARYAAPLAVQRGLTTLSGNVDKVLLEWLADTQQVGFYTANLGTSGAMFRLSTAATRVFFPRTVADAERGDLRSAGRRLDAVTRYLLLLGVPAVALVIAFSQEIVRITLGQDFVGSAPTLVVLILHGLCRMITAPYSSMLMALDKQSYLLPLRAVSLLVLVVGQLVLVPTEILGLRGAGLGSVGAAAALLLSALAALAMHITYTARFSGARPRLSLLWFFAGGFLMLAIIQVPAASGLPTTLPVKALFSVASGGVFLALVMVTRQVSRDELRMMIGAVNPVHLFQYARGELTSGEDSSR